MRAVVLDEYGDLDVLTIQDVPDPEPLHHEVVIDVTSIGLNRADLLQRMGMYPGPPMPKEIPGMEFAGVVNAVGNYTTCVSPGDHVMGIVGGGAYAEKLVTHERLCLPIPTSVPVEDAAAIPEVFITAFDALVVQGGLTSGKTALIHGGASGVGTAAIQICRAIGATAFVTCSGGKAQACTDLGAVAVIDYDTQDFAAEVRTLTNNAGVDVILDVIGGDYVHKNVKSIATGGRIIQVGLLGGASTELNVGLLLTKRASLIGTTLRSRPIEEKISISKQFATEMLPFFDIVRDGSPTMAPVIDTRFALDDIADAHLRMSKNLNVGKILIDVVSN